MLSFNCRPKTITKIQWNDQHCTPDFDVLGESTFMAVTALFARSPDLELTAY
jgi:hypothetical protein